MATEGWAASITHFSDVVAVLDVRHPAIMIAEPTPMMIAERGDTQPLAGEVDRLNDLLALQLLDWMRVATNASNIAHVSR